MTRRAAATARTRRRIVDATLELHERQGIAATSWDEIARKAGVGVGTVYRHFPSLAELVPACGVVTFERLDLPTPDGIPALFAGVRSRVERLQRLVETLHGLYERGAGSIENVRRERDELGLPVLHDAYATIEEALDRLHAEALAPCAPDAARLAVVRALTDIPLWRSLRGRGVSAADAVGAVVSAVDGALGPGGG